LYTIRAFKKNDNKIQDDLNVLSFVDGILLTVGSIRHNFESGSKCRDTVPKKLAWQRNNQ
jgi:hypothetical protein